MIIIMCSLKHGTYYDVLWAHIESILIYTFCRILYIIFVHRHIKWERQFYFWSVSDTHFGLYALSKSKQNISVVFE